MNQAADQALSALYHAPREVRAQQLAARYAPILRFDAREPFLPVAAGFTLFESDSPSPSMRRTIHLAPPGKPAAAAAIEYAIWWDWDIHHLYELEHIWVYLDGQGQVLRVEGSWHGEFKELAVQLEGEHPLVLSEPGKHAFADRPEPFLKRAGEVRRSETRHVGALAHVLINAMFAGQIRRKPYDDSLARGYLAQQVFDPAWDFSQTFRFDPTWLVPWPALRDWIPERVNAWLEHLEASLAPEQYRALRLAGGDGSPDALAAALAAGADGVVLPLVRDGSGQPATGHAQRLSGATPLAEVFQFCRSVPMRAVLDVQEAGVIETLAAFLNEKKLHGLVPVTAANPEWLIKLKALAPQAWVIVPLTQPEQDPLASAAATQAVGVLPRWDGHGSLTPAWVARAHAAGLVVMSGPLADADQVQALERQRLDIIWSNGI